MEMTNEHPVTESRSGSPTIQKKVEFDLTATSMQDFYEYRRKVKRGKYPTPFDASKRPKHSVLKDSTPSPINPFFKKAHNIKYWTPEVTTVQLIEQQIIDEAAESRDSATLPSDNWLPDQALNLFAQANK